VAEAHSDADADARRGEGSRDSDARPSASGLRALAAGARARRRVGCYDVVRGCRGLFRGPSTDRDRPWRPEHRHSTAQEHGGDSLRQSHAHGDSPRRLSGASVVPAQRAAHGDPGNDGPACLRPRRWPRRGGADSRVRRPSRPRQRGGRGCQAMALRAGQTRSRSGRCVGATPRGIPASIGAYMRIVVSMLILLLPVPAMAQPPAAPPSQQAPPRLEPVVVEGVRVPADRTRTDQEASEELSRVPGGTAVVDQTTIEQTRGANLKDVLDFVPGVMIRPRFGAADESQLSIRGSGLRNNFHLRGINVLIDGFIYGQADGFSDFESLELLTTKRIEIYKGANALRFGGLTLGGAINLVTKTGNDEGLIGLRSEGGSFGYAKNHLATGQVYGPFDVYASFTDLELQGYRDHSDQIRHRIYSTFGYDLGGGTTLRLDLGYVRNDENLPGALTRDEFEHNPR